MSNPTGKPVEEIAREVECADPETCMVCHNCESYYHRTSEHEMGGLERAEAILRKIAEGNLGPAPWQADYEAVRSLARAYFAREDK